MPESRRKTYERTGQKMRRLTLLLAIMGIALLLITGVAIADTINCIAGRGCVGTDGPDLLTGSGGGDDMDGRQDSDRLFGNEGPDWMLGDAYAAPNNDTSTDGNDIIKGGPGFDGLAGLGGDDLLRGGEKGDYFFAEESSANEGEDFVYGSTGDDYIEAKDGVKDTINCGTGAHDVVFFDKGGIDTVTNCEHKNPQFQGFSIASASSTPAMVSAEKLDALRAR
jgi:RTX calcium-binding nonapeptide repeat (4 copies)